MAADSHRCLPEDPKVQGCSGNQLFTPALPHTAHPLIWPEALWEIRKTEIQVLSPADFLCDLGKSLTIM